MLVKINFYGENNDEVSNNDSKFEFFRSFCVFVKNSLRNCDTVSRVDEYCIFIILPETLSDEPLDGVIKKILGFSIILSDVIDRLKIDVVPTISHIFYNASSSDMSFDEIMSTLYKTLSEYDNA